MSCGHSGFVTAWLAAWNTHDIEAVLAHFHDDACFVSPIAKQLIPDSQGSLKGKTAIRAYWQQALTLVPDLHFLYWAFMLASIA